MSYGISDLVSTTKRVAKWGVISGSFTESDLMYYIEDAYGEVQLAYPDLTVYTFTIESTVSGSSVSPELDIVDKVLIGTKAGLNVWYAYGQELIGDSIMIRAGSISLDTSRSLRAHGINLDFLEKQYKDMVQNLNIHGKTSDSLTKGIRLDSYISYKGESGASDSLIDETVT